MEKGGGDRQKGFSVGSFIIAILNPFRDYRIEGKERRKKEKKQKRKGGEEGGTNNMGGRKGRRWMG